MSLKDTAIKLKIINAVKFKSSPKFIKVYYKVPRGRKIYSMWIFEKVFKRGDYVLFKNKYSMFV